MNLNSKKLLWVFGLSLTITLLVISFSISQGKTVFDISFPNNPTDTAPKTITEAIQSFYKYALAISGILAAGMIAYGALNIALSGGIPDRMSEGKDAIYSALWGILLLFGSYFILKTINPELVILREPEAITNTKLTPGFCTKDNVPSKKPCGPNDTPLGADGKCQCYNLRCDGNKFTPEACKARIDLSLGGFNAPLVNIVYKYYNTKIVDLVQLFSTIFLPTGGDIYQAWYYNKNEVGGVDSAVCLIYAYDQLDLITARMDIKKEYAPCNF